MSWRDVVTYWFSDRTITHAGSLATQDLISLLIEKNTIPAGLTDNATLHSIMLTQVILEILNGMSVPRSPLNDNLTYRTNAKEAMMWDLTKKNEEKVIKLEAETGVSLDYYHRLGIKKLKNALFVNNSLLKKSY